MHLFSFFRLLSLTNVYLLLLEGENVGEDLSVLLAFPFWWNLTPITSTRSGGNFCFSLTPRKWGGKKKRKLRREKKASECGRLRKEKVLKLCSATSHAGKMFTVLQQPVREGEAKTEKANKRAIKSEIVQVKVGSRGQPKCSKYKS